MNAITPITPSTDETIFDPICDAINRISNNIQLIEALDDIVCQRLDDSRVGSAATDLARSRANEQIFALLDVSRRDLSSTHHVLSGAYDALIVQRGVAESTVGRHLAAKGWLKPHPKVAAAIRRWTATLERYDTAVERLRELPATDQAHDASVDQLTEEASRARDILIDTPAPGLPALRRKMAIILHDGLIGQEGVAAAILADIDELTREQEKGELHLVRTAAAEAVG